MVIRSGKKQAQTYRKSLAGHVQAMFLVNLPHVVDSLSIFAQRDETLRLLVSLVTLEQEVQEVSSANMDGDDLDFASEQQSVSQSLR